MIQLTRLNHVPIVVNSDLIECLESTPDTLVKLTNGETMMVLETVEQVVDRVVNFKRRIFWNPLSERISEELPLRAVGLRDKAEP